jgi:hypothetical protein
MKIAYPGLSTNEQPKKLLREMKVRAGVRGEVEVNLESLITNLEN